jgi:4-amino-4-deoxy-L-arabinose transferase-like glycosyltransferase
MREMPRKIPRALWIVLPLGFLLYFYRLDATGLLGPDEPRYASIARDMARTSDWITPRLWGEPWFEKPVLLYWMSGAAFRLGLGPELAPRLPVALLAVAFLVFYWWILNREFGCLAAWLSTLILGTSAAWLGFSQMGVTDLPLAAAFSAAMLLAMPWVARRDTKWLPVASAMLGFAVLAKSLVPLALSLPLVAMRYRWWRDLVRWRVVLPFAIVVTPWHVLCYLRNGRAFVETLFVQHQFGRFASGALGHSEPWWFYVPVLLALLTPWTPLLGFLESRQQYRDPRRFVLLLCLCFGLVVFSASVNKLPGYVLPLLPAAAALMGCGLAEARRVKLVLASCAVMGVSFLVAAPVLAAAVANGLSRAPHPAFAWTWFVPAAFAVLAWVFESRSMRLVAALCVAATAGWGTMYLKRNATPELDRLASARRLAASADREAVCVESLKRDLRYGLNYYTVVPLPDCSVQPKPYRIVQTPGLEPVVEPPAESAAGRAAATPRLTRTSPAL